MAIERTQAFVLDIGKSLNVRFANLQAAITKVRLKEEDTFQRAILDNNLSLEAQITYRKEQLEMEKGKLFPDSGYMSIFKTSIVQLNKRNRYKTFVDEFNDSFRAFELGRKTLSQHLTFLEGRLVGAEDDDIREELKNKIHDSQTLVQDRYWEVLQADIDLKTKDGTISALQKAIELAQTGSVKASLEKNELQQKVLETTRMVLDRELQTAQMLDDERTIDLKRYGGQGIDVKMDWLKGKYSGSSLALSPFKVGDTIYNSERDYWQDKLNGFVGEFIESKENEFKNDIYSDQNKLNLVKTDTVTKIRETTESYLADPILAQYSDKFNIFKQNIYNEVISQKMENLSSRLIMQNTREGIQNIKTEVNNLQKIFPEISFSPYTQNLEASYAEKQKKELEKLLDTKMDNLSLISSYLGKADLTEATRQKWFATIQDQMTDIISIKNLEIPYADLTMDKPFQEFVADLKSRYPFFQQDLTLQNLQLEEAQGREAAIPSEERVAVTEADVKEIYSANIGREPTPEEIQHHLDRQTTKDRLLVWATSSPEAQAEKRKIAGAKITEPVIEPKPVTIEPTPVPVKIEPTPIPELQPPAVVTPTPEPTPTPEQPVDQPKYTEFLGETAGAALRIFKATREEIETEAKKEGVEIVQFKGFREGKWEIIQ